MSVIELTVTAKVILWVIFFGWCWFMLKWSSIKVPDSGWVGRSKDNE